MMPSYGRPDVMQVRMEVGVGGLMAVGMFPTWLRLTRSKAVWSSCTLCSPWLGRPWSMEVGRSVALYGGLV